MKTTVFLITNSTQRFAFADDIIVLDKGRIHLQGSWNALSHDLGEISKVVFGEHQASKQEARLQTRAVHGGRNHVGDDAASDLARRTGDMTVYDHYFRSARYSNLLVMLAFTMTYSVFVTLPQYWLKWWTEADSDATWFYVTGYLMLATLAWTSTNGQMW
ncbi:hypothetical protein MBLNU459_g3012t1 [Dothideomycetes sp. NU459]